MLLIWLPITSVCLPNAYSNHSFPTPRYRIPPNGSTVIDLEDKRLDIWDRELERFGGWWIPSSTTKQRSWRKYPLSLLASISVILVSCPKNKNPPISNKWFTLLSKVHFFVSLTFYFDGRWVKAVRRCENVIRRKNNRFANKAPLPFQRKRGYVSSICSRMQMLNRNDDFSYHSSRRPWHWLTKPGR